MKMLASSIARKRRDATAGLIDVVPELIVEGFAELALDGGRALSRIMRLTWLAGLRETGNEAQREKADPKDGRSNFRFRQHHFSSSRFSLDFKNSESIVRSKAPDAPRRMAPGRSFSRRVRWRQASVWKWIYAVAKERLNPRIE
ncbi:hypothetical protein OGR47_11780 [Methylocystis sp. MJC1]|uniref:hypothetical protein n=1 Tax=Methylocystis sp. MJC1 TaxID=2654282 RepID=UPI0013EA0247|nr:hypothetical protein [Methylocystis sp. MJC1]MBU6527659.1 hypothetical protein [Methylocystis sp. MJC1]UZX10596.1 hypothetical protein OGR47_11780 [Methylocystis sp. MJC1]